MSSQPRLPTDFQQEEGAYLYLNSFVNEDQMAAMAAKYGEIDVKMGCRHGQDFEADRVKNPFPEALQEVTMIAESLYDEILAPANSNVEGEGIEVDIPFENPYWHSGSTNNVHTKKNASWYVTCAVLSMFMTQKELYAVLIQRRRTLLSEFLVSAINSTIYKHPTDDSEGTTMMFVHCYMAIKIIMADLYWDNDHPKPSKGLEIARGFLFGDAQLLHTEIGKELAGYDGSYAWILSYLAEKTNCNCMKHLVKVVPAPKAKAIESDANSFLKGLQFNNPNPDDSDVGETPKIEILDDGEPSCVVCGKGAADGEGGKLHKCGRCKSEEELYCGKECQAKRWKVHKKQCGPKKKKPVVEEKKAADDGFISFDEYMKTSGGAADMFKDPVQAMINDGTLNAADVDLGGALNDLDINI